MEGVPRLPMIHFELRLNPQKNVHLGSNLLNYIREYYQEDPNNYVSEIQNLEKLRALAMRPTRDVDGCAILKRYYCQLCFLMKKLPVLKDNPSSTDQITWKEVWWSLSGPKQVNFKAEYVLMLYNIGALHSILGAENDRSSADGLKLACTHFQCATWAFQEVNTTALRAEEFDPKYFGFLIYTCLAQAQECILEKSMTDSRKPIISAKVAAQIADYYKTAVNAGNSSKGEDVLFNDMKISNTWINYAAAKRTYYECLSLLFLGIHAEEEEKMGERVTYYNAASDKLNSIVIPKFQESEFNKKFEDAITFTRDVVEGKKKIANNENDFIYHEPVPSLDKLPVTRGAVLVRPIPVNCSDPDICGSDIFSRLIPIRVHKISSIYSEEKAKLLRNIISAVEEKDTELNLVMDSFKFDVLNLEENLNPLPDDLVERCAASNARPDLVPNLHKALGTLTEEHSNVEIMMIEIKELIEKEEKAEKKYQESMKTSRPPSIVATDLACEAKKYTEALSKASESNMTLTKAVDTHTSNLNILSRSLDELQKHLPKINTIYSSEEESVIRELNRLVQKVNQMKAQRVTLVNKLRESIQNDDIVNQLVLNDENEGSNVIAKELEKHQTTAKLIEQNLTAQENILKAITDTYASYGPIRKRLNEMVQERKTIINALIESYDQYEDVISKISKGIEFYNKLEANVRKLLQRVKGTCKVQQEERQQMYAKIKTESNIEKDTPLSPTTLASLKLKHHIAGRKPFIGFHQSTDISSPVNPYYNDVNSYSAARGVTNISTPHGAAGGISTPSSVENVERKHYSTMSRPAPVGSEMTKPPSTASEPGSTPFQYQGDKKFVRPATRNSIVNSDFLKFHQNTIPPDTQLSVQPTININAQQPLPSSNYGTYNSFVNDGRSFNTQSYFNANPYSTTELSTNLPPLPPSSSSSYHVYNDSYKAASSTYIPPSSGSVSTRLHCDSKNISSPSYNGYATQNVSNATDTRGFLPRDNLTVQISHHSFPNQSSTVNNHDMSKMMQSPINSISQNPTSTSLYSATADSAGMNVNYASRIENARGVAAYYGYSQPVPVITSAQNYSSVNYPVTSIYANNSIHPSNIISPNYSNASQLSTTYPVSTPRATLTYLPATNQSNYGVVTNVSHNYYTTVTSGHGNGAAQVESSNVLYDYRMYGNKFTSSQNQPVTNGIINGGSSSPYFISQYGYQNQLSNVAVPSSSSVSTTNLPHAPANTVTYMQANEGDNKKLSSTYAAANVTSSSSENETSRSANKTKKKKTTDIKPKKIESSYVDLLSDLNFSISDPVLTATVVTPATTEAVVTSASLTDTQVETDIVEISNEIKAVADIEKSNMKDTRDVSLNEITKVKPSADPFLDNRFLDRFKFEVEKFEKFVQRLTMKTLNGSIPIDTMWTDYVEKQKIYSAEHSCDVAEKNASRNRFPDDTPYDKYRIKLSNLENDYINASLCKIESCNVPNFIITEAPVPSTFSLFWNMIWQYEVEQIICLVADTEVGNDIYWPKDRSQNLEFDDLKIVLHNINLLQYHTERVLSITKGDVSRVVIHLQLNSWPQSVEYTDGLLNMIKESLTFYYGQRSLQRSIVAHGLSARDRTGMLVLIYAAIAEIHSGNEIIKIVPLSSTVCNGRKTIVNGKEDLLMTFQTFSRYACNLLSKYACTTEKERSIEVAESTISSVFDTIESTTNNADIKISANFVDTSSKVDSVVGGETVSMTATIQRFDSNETNVDSKPLSLTAVDIPDRKLLSKEENKRRNMERFSNANNLQAIVPDKTSADPLNTIDPLWTIKKK